MKVKEIGKYFVLAAISMAVLYVWYPAVGVTDLGNWNHGLRNVLAGVIFVFAAQLVTGRSLFHPSWRPGLVIFYLWLAAFSYIQAKSGGNWGIRVETLNNDVLTLMPVLVLTFLMEYIGSLCQKIRLLLRIFNFLLIGYLSLSVFVYMTYYKIFGAGFTSTDMISVLLTNSKEAMEFLQSHLGFSSLAVVLVLFAVYMIFIGRLIVKGSRINEDRGVTSPALVKKVIIAVLTIAALVTIAHWIPRIFPAWPYHVAHKYLMNSQKSAKAHEKNLESLKFVGTPEKLPGSVIVVIGESANRDHLKAFNPKYPADTTPWLSKEKDNKDFYLLSHAYSNYPLTAQALSMFLTDVNQYNHRELSEAVTLTDVANKAGYSTWWISNQTPSAGNVMLALSARNSIKELWTKQTAKDDMDVLDLLKTVPKNGSHFIIIHLEGSHDRYKDRVPPDFAEIHTDGQPEKVNEYDTSIAYTDKVLENIYQYARDNLNLQAMVYCSDHGEDMQYFHGDGNFTWDMVHVPMWIYLSNGYQASHSAVADNLRNNVNKVFTNDLVFDTVCGLLGTPNNGYESRYDLTSGKYNLPVSEAVTKHGKVQISEDPAIQ
ncbi:phosphoethanolamine transferase [uncultured Dialister sp.]|uniref:phosphoethanolamine transferase n=1 Tax=uncultured Dialister sp. TaxID=278064 RepID=UPI002588A793|nr:phosphoethanolamine transferase [uncultured Dialister sp.]